MISIEQAFELLQKHVSALGKTEVPLSESVGRILANEIKADLDSPPHDKSVMDGFAVRSDDINSGTNRLKVCETVIAGGVPSRAIQSGEATRIMTGAPVPDGSDAVVMVEQTSVESDSTGDQIQEWVTIELESLASEKHLLRRGANFQKEQTIIETGHLIRPTDVGLLAEVGAATVTVGSHPSVAVLPTGNELVDHSATPASGQIRNSNGPMLIAMAKSYGLNVTDLGVGLDDESLLKDKIKTGLKNDILILSGGVSAGTMDLVPGILKDLGVKEVFHKVCVKPGKPIWFGVKEPEPTEDDSSTLVFGLPGNPVSSLVGFQLFVRATIEKMRSGKAIQSPSPLVCELSQSHETRGNRPTFWPGSRVSDESAVRKVEPLIWNGSSDLLALGKAEGLIHFPASSQIHPAGVQVHFHPFE
jgi:molybdopterin molybdotransferase